ncbi:hypothetical protein [Thermogutta sp.]|uniref:hypothetical protein n=1 Tax=Thermogutta sp. TaxID=1962930 RepID=UPI003C7C34EB
MRPKETSAVPTFAVLLTILSLAALAASHPDGKPCAWASDNGPVLFAPSEADLGAGPATADSRDDLPRAYQSAEIQRKVGDNRSGSVSSSAESDGWFAKGQAAGRAPFAAAADHSRPSDTGSARKVEVPPAVITAPRNAVPLSSGISTPTIVPPGTVYSPSVVPYPYGTPAPVPPLQEQPRPFLGISLPRLFNRNRSAEPSPFARWWNSLWGKPPANALQGPPSSSAPSGTVIAGPGAPATSPSWGGGSGSATVISSPGSPRPSTTSGGNPLAAQGWSAYAVPYALPPSGSSPTLVPPPLTATPAVQTPAVPASKSAGTGVPGLPSGASGTSDSPFPNTFSGGWGASATNLSATASGTVATGPSAHVSPPAWPSSPGSQLQLPPYPGTVGASSASPGARPSVWDRVKKWWSDVTAPKGVQGRAALLPPGGQPRPGVFRASPPPASDPFTSRTSSVPSWATPQATVLPSGSPAVLPPPAPQLPLRQAW